MTIHTLERRPEADRPKDRARRSRLLSLVLLILSLLLMAYPVAATVWNDYRNVEVARKYEEEVTQSPDTLAGVRDRAEEYNTWLDSAGHHYRREDPADPEYQDYLSQLRVAEGSSIMSRLTIPDIGVDLPVYHGTTDDVLYRGAGHMYGSDLPIGGDGNTAVITAHTGMVNASMFDNLYKLKEGEPVYVSVLGEKLRYRMTGSEIVKPDEYDAVTYEEGVDKIVLITCTPYGINSDRLLVTVVRDHTPLTVDEMDSGWRVQLSWWMKLDLALMAVIAAVAMWSALHRRRKLRKEESEAAAG
ncbi:class C sortase [Corynebacterium sp.]|uniref:class C sortase n=1 Tax=Corynebacterium sp. TaxID=1720 RepID=UPI00198F7BC4|nr:class C sortase [Corynebacterium sp.]HHU68324.1 class C sortase [Corynebacterium sp.]